MPRGLTSAPEQSPGIRHTALSPAPPSAAQLGSSRGQPEWPHVVDFRCAVRRQVECPDLAQDGDSVEESTRVAALGANDRVWRVPGRRPREEYEVQRASAATKRVCEHALTIGELHATARVNERRKIGRLHHRGECPLLVRVLGVVGSTDLGHWEHAPSRVNQGPRERLQGSRPRGVIVTKVGTGYDIEEIPESPPCADQQPQTCRIATPATSHPGRAGPARVACPPCVRGLRASRRRRRSHPTMAGSSAPRTGGTSHALRSRRPDRDRVSGAPAGAA